MQLLSEKREPLINASAPGTHENANRPLIALREVTRTFGEGSAQVHALRAISLDIHPGESLSIMGRSGSGKSTLLNILGLLDAPSTGTCEILGMETTAMQARQLDKLRAKTFGFVFQAFHLVPYLTVRESVEMGVTYHRQPRALRLKSVDEYLEKVGMTHRAHAQISTLSGGEKQRTAIARALVRKPNVLLADEPTGNLDEATALDVLAIFDSIVADGVALVMVTHDSMTAARTDHRVMIRDGIVDL